MKKTLLMALAMGAGVLAGVPAMATTNAPQVGQEASIPFVSHGGIRNWQVVDDNTLMIEGTGNRWYRAELFGPCIGLRFTDFALGFETRGIDSFDRFGAIRTRDGRCQLKSLTVAAPPVKARKG